MEVIYHPLVRRDVLEIRRYYRNISSKLTDEFRDELRDTISRAAENPLRFPPVERGFRRANLKRFPYHVLYEVQAQLIRVMLVRHHKRHPQFGLARE
jgi:plasmid stabilization system protein ParE